MRPRFEIRPLGLWDRPVTDPRASASRFRAGWFDTVDHLTREVDLLGGDVIAVQVDATDADIRRDGMLRSRSRVGFPGVKISFASRFGPLTYATDAYDHWQANVRAIALALEALRAVDRYGVTSTGEQYRGWTAIAAQPFAHGDLTVDEAERVLREAGGVPDDLPLRNEVAITAAFRRAARTHHPDAGGNAEAFQLIANARDVLLAAFRGGGQS